MKQGIIYGGAFVFAFMIVTGLLIYLNSSYENIFQFNFNPKLAVQLKDSSNTLSYDSTAFKDSSGVTDSVLFSDIKEVGGEDSVNTDLKKGTSNTVTESVEEENPNAKIKDQPVTKNQMLLQPNQNGQITENLSNIQEYKDWVQKVTSIYSAMEPKKAAKIIQTYSDNVARDILYNMSKKTAAKVVSELSPETANRIFRFE